MIYNENIKCRVVRLFGVNSDIYYALIKGEKISKRIRSYFNESGFKIVREREKKKLYEDCRDAELEYERKTNLDFSL